MRKILLKGQATLATNQTYNKTLVQNKGYKICKHFPNEVITLRAHCTSSKAVAHDATFKRDFAKTLRKLTIHWLIPHLNNRKITNQFFVFNFLFFAYFSSRQLTAPNHQNQHN